MHPYLHTHFLSNLSYMPGTTFPLSTFSMPTSLSNSPLFHPHHPLISIIPSTCMRTVHACRHPSSLHHHLLSLYPRPHHHSDLSAREPSSVARERAAAKQPFIPHEPRRSRLWDSAPLPQFRAPFSKSLTAAGAPSSSTASAMWSTAPSAKTPIFWCRGLESHVSPPPRRCPRSRHPFPLL